MNHLDILNDIDGGTAKYDEKFVNECLESKKQHISLKALKILLDKDLEKWSKHCLSIALKKPSLSFLGDRIAARLEVDGFSDVKWVREKWPEFTIFDETTTQRIFMSLRGDTAGLVGDIDKCIWESQDESRSQYLMKLLSAAIRGRFSFNKYFEHHHSIVVRMSTEMNKILGN